MVSRPNAANRHIEIAETDRHDHRENEVDQKKNNKISLCDLFYFHYWTSIRMSELEGRFESLKFQLRVEKVDTSGFFTNARLPTR